MIKTRLMKLLKGSERYIAQNVLWQWLALLFQIAAIFAAGTFLQSMMMEHSDTVLFLRTGLIVFCAFLVRFFCERMAAISSGKASADIKPVLRRQIYEKLLRIGASYNQKMPTSEVVQVTTEGVEQLEIYYGKYLPQLFYSLLAPVTLFVILCPISWKASLVLLICVPLIPVSIVAVHKFAKKLLNKYWGIYTELGDSFLENLQGLTTLKIYQADGRKADEMDLEAERFRKITMKVLTMQLNSVSVMDIVAYGGAAIGMIVTILEYGNGAVDFAGAFTMILLASEFFIPLRLLGSFFHIAMNGMSASDKIFRILDMAEEADGTQSLTDGPISADLRHVAFSYNMEKPVLREISMTIPAGSFVSLVGVSGCGKSTVSGLLTGKLRQTSGEIRINQIPLTDIKERDLMQSVTLIRHNSYLFKGTVRDNLLMGNPDASESQMKEALEKVRLLDFLDGQKGLDTELDEQGNNFSGGQRQRLAIARALLHNTPMYILDEAASNIDVESEDQIMEVVRELAKTKTVLFISHRLANVTASDCIYMMENGMISESGTHEELMRQNGSYAAMFRRQQDLCKIRGCSE